MQLLTLDLARSVGWTCGPMPDPCFAYGTARLPAPSENLAVFFQAYEAWLNAKCGEGQGVNYIVFEAPIMPKFTRIETLRQLYGLCAITELLAINCNIKCREASIPKIRKFMCGSGSAKKQDVWTAVRACGYRPSTTDESDAIALRFYVIGHERVDLLKKMRMDLGPLGIHT